MSVWNDSRAASVGDMSEERDGDEDSAGVGGDSGACGEDNGGTGGLFRSGAAEARGVTERDLEAASAVNSRTHGGIRCAHTRETMVVGKPTGRRGHDRDGTRPRKGVSARGLRDERRYLGARGRGYTGLRDERGGSHRTLGRRR